jgi:DNA-binding MarR family transcriptional regulator
MDELGLTSGTISVRMDRLVAQGLVDRRADPGSARNTLISLTPQGRELFERVVPAHLNNERRLLSGLSDEELELLAALLRKLAPGCGEA